jgi:hypothetical protein
VFRCERDGYEAVVFGAFDGATSWINNAFVDLGPLHQEMVDAHEERHLVFQKSTSWGMLLMLLVLLDPARPELIELTEACRGTHEAYATYLSAAHVRDGISTLQGNAVYLEHWRTGAALADAFEEEGVAVLAVLEHLFRLAMAPAALADVALDSTFDGLLAHAPDARVARITRLLSQEPSVAAQIAAVVSDGADAADVEDQLAVLLSGYDVPTLTTGEQLACATRLMDQFNSLSDALRACVAERSPATSLADQLDHQQHAILGVQRVPVALHVGPPPPAGGEHPLTGFVMDDEHLGAHVWGVILSAAVIERQFQPTSPLGHERYWGFLAVDRRGEEHSARLWPLEEAPARVTTMLAEQGIRTVLMTTMSTLTDAFERTPLSPSTPVFVLVDLPVLAFLRGLEAESQTVRWVHAEATGARLLQLLVLKLDGPDPLHFVIVRSTHTVRSTVEWLRRSSGFDHDPGLADNVGPFLAALAQHLAGTFWAFETTHPADLVVPSDDRYGSHARC